MSAMRGNAVVSTTRVVFLYRVGAMADGLRYRTATHRIARRRRQFRPMHPFMSLGAMCSKDDVRDLALVEKLFNRPRFV
jgi:hypothetical protein